MTTTRVARARLRRLVSISAGFLLLAAACGDDSDDAADATNDVSASTTTTAAEATSDDSLATTTTAEATSDDSLSTTTTAAGPSEEDAEWQAIVEDAEAEGTVTLYAALIGIESLPAAFSETYPDIELEAIRLQSPELVEKLNQEAGAGGGAGDVALMSGDAWFVEAISAGNLISPHEGPASEPWIDTDFWRDEFVIPIVQPYVIGFNTTAVDPIEDWDELSDPAFAGAMGTCEPRANVFVAFYDYMQEQTSETFMSEFAALKPVQNNSSTVTAQQLASGELDVGVCMVPGALETLMAEGAPIDYRLPSPTLGLPAAAGIPAWSPHPNAAQVLLDWMLSEPGQEWFIETQGQIATPLGDTLEGAASAGDVDMWDSAEYPPEVTDERRAYWTGVLAGG